MDTRLFVNSFLLLLVSSFCLRAAAEVSGSVVYLEGSSGKYLRNQRLDDSSEIKPSSLAEVAGAVSILLGFAPSSSFSADSSSKLNEVLMPNPFDRPHAVFLLQVEGLDDIDYTKIKAGTSLNDKIEGSNKASIQLPGEEEVSVMRVDESLEGVCDAACLDEEFINLAKLLDGSYSDGKLSLPLASGASLDLHLAKEAELQFATSLLELVRGVMKAVQFHEANSGTIVKPAELITGTFTGFKALEGENAKHANEIFHKTLSMLFDILHSSYEGKIVGIVVCKKEQDGTIEVTSSPRVAFRFLGETSSDNSTATTLAEIYLVRITLAWITGIILLVSTLLGVCMLCYMPITRDTLLYSNVKLD